MTNANKILMILALAAFMVACGGGDSTTTEEANEAATEAAEKPADPKGIGEVTHVELTDPLNEEMIAQGKSIYEMKCSSCHRLTEKRVVGPGWAGITNRRTPEWIMNMTTNVDVMLDEDPEARKLLEECLVRMPNQGVSVDEARSLVEFMRENDIETIGEKDKAAI